MTRRARFGVHPSLEHALAAIKDDDLPDDIDAILPAQRRLSCEELVAIGRMCATHIDAKVGRAQRAEFDRLTALVDRFIAHPPSGPGDQQAWWDLGQAARRDAEYARGPLKIIALTAWATSVSGPEAASMIGEVAKLALKVLAKDSAARVALVRALCAAFR